MKVVRTIVVTALLAGCGKSSGYWQDQLAADPLFIRANALSQNQSCAALVPMEYGRTYPVPKQGKDAAYQVLFYPAAISKGASIVATPRYQGDFAVDTSAKDACAKLPDSGPLKDLGPSVPASYSPAAYYKLQVALYQALEKTAALYFKGGELGSGDKAALSDFADTFPRLAEPGLLPYYYRLNPDFWEWLRKESGASIPNPSTQN